MEKKSVARIRRHERVRKKITGTAERPRLSVFRSNYNISAQIIDDGRGVTLAMASSREPSVAGKKGSKNIATARKVGQLLASRAKEKAIHRVVFDKGGYLYHGKVKALADGAREGGLEF